MFLIVNCGRRHSLVRGPGQCKSREGRLDGKLVKKQVFDIHSLLFDLDYGYDTTYCLSSSQEF